MSALGGSAVVREKIGVELILNLGEYIKAREIVDKDLLKAQQDAEKAAKRREAFNKAVVAAFNATVAGLKKGYAEVSASIERIAKARGEDDPTVQAFRGMERAGKSAFDTFVRGALSSGTASVAMANVTREALALAESAKAVGVRFDAFVQNNAPTIIDIATRIGGTFEAARISVSSLSGGFQTFGGVVSVVAGHVGAVIGAVGKAASGLEVLGSRPLSGLAEGAEDLQRLSQAFAGEGMKDIAEGSAASVAAWEGGLDRIADAADRAGESARKFIEDAKRESEKPKPREGGIILENEGREKAILAGMRQIATSVEQVFSGSAAAIADTFTALSQVARDQFDAAAAATLGAAGAAFGGLSSFAAQAERAFGSSAAAAEVFARVQLGLQAVLAVVGGLDQMAKASAATAENPAAVGPHKIAAGLYFATAALAGGQAVGAFGNVAGGSSTGSGRREPQSAATGVARREQKIEIVVQGNLLGNEEYVRNTVVPALKRLARDRDVSVTK